MPFQVKPVFCLDEQIVPGDDIRTAWAGIISQPGYLPKALLLLLLPTTSMIAVGAHTLYSWSTYTSAYSL